MSNSTYAVVLAGGSGMRFWPVSRNDRPKQLLNLFGESTLLEQTLSRLKGLMEPEHILVLTNSEQEEAVRALATDLPAENILAEPAKRDTAPAIALGVGWVAARDPEATMLVLPADQLIRDEEVYQELMRGAVEVAQKSEALVTIGIKPTWACPSYGYIERGRRVDLPKLESDVAAYEVTRFREKPNTELAEKFLAEGNYSWNAGMFLWSVPAAVREMTKHCPDLAEFVREVRTSTDLKATLNSQFKNLKKISIDYALMEKSSRVLNIEANFDWDDLGSWISAAKYLDHDEADNATNVPLNQIGAADNIVYSLPNLPQISLLGVSNLVIVQTDDALLIADRDQAEKIKKIAAQAPSELH